MRRLLLILACSLVIQTGFSQNGNFRSRISGTWSVPTTWERDADSNGTYEESPSSVAPSSTDGTIIIQNTHVVRVYTNVAIDQTVIQSGGRIAINTGNVLTVVDGTGADLVNSGIISTTAVGQLVISGAAEFVYAKNGGAMPLATWQDNSICTITGVTTGAPSGLNPSGGFYHFRWENNGQSTTVNLNGNLTFIRGNFDVLSTNGQILALSTSSAPLPVNIGGNFSIQGTSRMSFASTANITINVAGDFNFSSVNTSGTTFSSSTGQVTLDVASDFNMAADDGSLDLAAGTGTGTLRVGGNFTLTSGTIRESSTGTGAIHFDGNSIQTFINSGSIITQVDHIIASGATLSIIGENAVTGRSLTVNGSLQLGSLNATGAIVLGTTLGNVRTLTRTFNDASTVIYAGTGPQFIGNGHPAIETVTTVIDNPNGVTFNATTASNSGAGTLRVGSLSLTAGDLHIESATTGRSLRVDGTVSALAGNYVIINGNSTDITVGGTGAFGTFPFPEEEQTIRTLTINRPGSTVVFSTPILVRIGLNLTQGNLAVEDLTTVNGAMSLGEGTTLFFEGASLTMAGSYTSSGGLLSANGESTLTLRGSGALNQPLNFSPTGNTVGTLELNKSNSGISASITSALNITDHLTLTDGQLDITNNLLTLANGATLSKSSISAISGSSPSGGPWNLIYTLGSATTGLEIPANGQLESLTVNTSSGTITLSQDITINGALAIVPGNVSFASGTNDIVAGSFSNAGTFSPPHTTEVGFVVAGNFSNSGTYSNSNGNLSVGGAFVNNGTCNVGTGTVTFNGTSTIGGTTPVSFHHITIDGALTAPSQLSLTGNFVNNGTFNAGAGRVNFNGTGLQVISGSALTSFYNIDVNNTTSPVSVSVESDQALQSLLTLASNVKFDADGAAGDSEFTLLSTATRTGSVAALPAGAVVQGNVTVQRFMAAVDNDYRFIAVPVTNVPVSQLQDDFSVTGTFTGTSFPCTGCTENGPSLRYYNESAKGEFDNGYGAVPATGGTNAETLTSGLGYSAYMWNGVNDVTIDVSGPLNQGAFAFPQVKHTASTPAVPSADGWNLVGNPYPSAIQWNGGSGWNRSANIDPTVWVWDVLQGVWRSCNYTSPAGSTLPNCLIASGQAFWVYVTPGPATLSVNEAAKNNGNATYYREKSASYALNVSLRSGNAFDNAFVIVSDKGTKSFDFGLDSYKPEMGIETVSVILKDTDGQKMGYYAVNSGDLKDMEIPVAVTARNTGSYELAFEIATNEFEGYFLLDKYLNTVTALGEGYTFTITSDPASYGDRFLISKNTSLVAFTSEEAGVKYYPNPVSGKLYVDIPGDNVVTSSLLNGVGQKLGDVRMENHNGGSRGEIDMTAMPSGFYFLKVNRLNKAALTLKVLKK